MASFGTTGGPSGAARAEGRPHRGGEWPARQHGVHDARRGSGLGGWKAGGERGKWDLEWMKSGLIRLIIG